LYLNVGKSAEMADGRFAWKSETTLEERVHRNWLWNCLGRKIRGK